MTRQRKIKAVQTRLESSSSVALRRTLRLRVAGVMQYVLPLYHRLRYEEYDTAAGNLIDLRGELQGLLNTIDANWPGIRDAEGGK